MLIRCNIIKKPFAQSNRSLFYWINLQFNALDEERKKQLGPDRTCAEWILRNGGNVKWANSNEPTTDYNDLPKEQEGKTLRLQEVDASNTNVMHNGFVHFKGCDYLTKIVLHRCNYLDDRALAELHYVKKSLQYLRITSCANVTDSGLLQLDFLKNLNDLVVYDLESVKNLQKTVAALKSSLPKCNMQTQ